VIKYTILRDLTIL